MAADHASLLDLTPELLSAILDNIHDPQDLLSLRLVCRTTAPFTEQRMAETWFSTIDIMYPVPRSLRNAIQIAKHPVWSKAVRSVHIHECTLSTQALLNPGFPAKIDLSDRRRRGEDLADHRRKRQEHFSKLEDQQMLIGANGHDLYLESIFFGLKTHGRKLRVTVDDAVMLWQRAHLARNPIERGDSTMPVRYRELIESNENDDAKIVKYLGDRFVDREALAHVWDTHGPLPAILRAMRVSEVRLDAFTVDSTRFAVSWASFSNPWGFPQPMKNFTKLSSLELRLEKCSRTGDPAECAGEVEAFVRFLQQLAPELKVLNLSMAFPVPESRLGIQFGISEEQSHMMYHRLFGGLTMLKLEKLTLQGFEVRFSTLVKFLRRHSGCLRKLLLEGLVTGCPPSISKDQWREGFCRELERVGFSVEDGLNDCVLEVYP